MNLGDILSALYDRFGMPKTPDSADIRRLRGYINSVQREVLGKKGFSSLRFGPVTFTSTANSPFASMPQAVNSIMNVVDRTNQRVLDPISLPELRRRAPNPTLTASIPSAYTVENFMSAVALQPTAACELFVISDAAGDGSGISAYVEGVTSAGYTRRANVGMNGAVAVSLSAAIVDWLRVTKFYVSASATGNITLHQGSGVGTELARITPGRSFARYTMLELSPVPASAYTYYSDVELRIDDMISPKDESVFPEDYHYILEAGAMEKEYLKREKAGQAVAEAKRKDDGIKEMRSFLRRRSGSTNSQAQFSQLGAWFPAGS